MCRFGVTIDIRGPGVTLMRFRLVGLMRIRLAYVKDWSAYRHDLCEFGALDFQTNCATGAQDNRYLTFSENAVESIPTSESQPIGTPELVLTLGLRR